ncbi:MAG: hypothetical protein QOE11_1079 [Solirubrobacteraceae bacterium]|jgi:hypothetical protein|nr:hypothetical protein [Solirubrobacteraceae bacterium]
MDLRRMRSGELLAAVSGAGLLLVMFLPWFGDRSAWEALAIGRVLLVAVAVLALTLVGLTLTARPVAMAGSAASITVGVAALTLLLLLFRIVVDEPGQDAGSAIDPGAYLGFVLVLGCAAGAWRSLADERTGAPASLRQTERVLAVRGAPRPPPPERDPSRVPPPPPAPR